MPVEPRYSYVAAVAAVLAQLGFQPVGVQALVTDAGSGLVRSGVRNYQLHGVVAIFSWFQQALTAVNRSRSAAMDLVQRSLVALRSVRTTASLQEATSRQLRRDLISHRYGTFAQLLTGLHTLARFLHACWQASWRHVDDVCARAATVTPSCRRLLIDAERAIALLFCGPGGCFPLRASFPGTCVINSTLSPNIRRCRRFDTDDDDDDAGVRVSVGLANKQKRHVNPQLYLPPPVTRCLARLLDAVPQLAEQTHLTGRCADALRRIIAPHAAHHQLPDDDVLPAGKPLRPALFRRVVATLLQSLLYRRLLLPAEYAAAVWQMAHGVDVACKDYNVLPSMEPLLAVNSPAALRRAASSEYSAMIGKAAARSAITQPRSAMHVARLTDLAAAAWHKLDRFIATCTQQHCACELCGASIVAADLHRHACYEAEFLLYTV